jgi:hypothetical protein
MFLFPTLHAGHILHQIAPRTSTYCRTPASSSLTCIATHIYLFLPYAEGFTPGGRILCRSGSCALPLRDIATAFLKVLPLQAPTPRNTTDRARAHMAEHLCGCPHLDTADGARILCSGERWTPNTITHVNQRLSRFLISRA